MAVNTANTILKSSTTETGTYTKLVDIKSYPDLGSTPNKLDTTDLSVTSIKTSILGLQELGDLTYECNYTKASYDTLKALEGTTMWFQLEFGENGVDGKFRWSGQVSVFAAGGGVDEVRGMTLTLSAETEITPVVVTP